MIRVLHLYYYKKIQQKIGDLKLMLMSLVIPFSNFENELILKEKNKLLRDKKVGKLINDVFQK